LVNKEIIIWKKRILAGLSGSSFCSLTELAIEYTIHDRVYKNVFGWSPDTCILNFGKILLNLFMKLFFFLVGDQPPSQTPVWGPHAIFGKGLHDEPEEHLCKRLVGERLILVSFCLFLMGT